jgi:hypothetical protein
LKVLQSSDNKHEYREESRPDCTVVLINFGSTITRFGR